MRRSLWRSARLASGICLAFQSPGLAYVAKLKHGFETLLRLGGVSVEVVSGLGHGCVRCVSGMSPTLIARALRLELSLTMACG
jgi:hypothetical protein